MSNDEPPAPMMRPARSVVTGTPCAPSVRSTSKRLSRCRESASPEAGSNPPR
jgi:hypothetical protein